MSDYIEDPEWMTRAINAAYLDYREAIDREAPRTDYQLSEELKKTKTDWVRPARIDRR
jgi:hypothetical protein